ncbi:hypothetical protein CYMTET_34134 [Cymbomonas tetramitiformis]|uniref:Uncharacterized protein n=1 Tax=Cymbomonas tetramitiformis TaxID=36881 RepID=A0AAE0FC87_9CHLO|nr:hypothetical protein CYMTET_34134 [Cymbomonas tetramitiformis]
MANNCSHSQVPSLAFILQFYNKLDNIPGLYQRIRATGQIHQFVVLEDGSQDGSLERWQKVLAPCDVRDTAGSNVSGAAWNCWEKREDQKGLFPPSVLARTEDLHEIRSYMNGIALAHDNDVFAFLQDDDFPPSDGKWVNPILRVFMEVPRLGLVSCKRGFTGGRWFNAGRYGYTTWNKVTLYFIRTHGHSMLNVLFLLVELEHLCVDTG